MKSCVADGLTVKEIRSNSEFTLSISDIRMLALAALNRNEVKLAKQRMPVVVMTASEINKSEFSPAHYVNFCSEVVTVPFAIEQLIGTVRKYAGVTEQHRFW